jgi:hypothetical protein
MPGGGTAAAGVDGAALPDDDTRSSVLPLDDCEYRDVSPDATSDPSSDACDETRRELWRRPSIGIGGSGLVSGGGLVAAGYRL